MQRTAGLVVRSRSMMEECVACMMAADWTETSNLLGDSSGMVEVPRCWYEC